MKREEINSLSQQVELKKLKKLYKKIEENYKVQILAAPTEQTLLIPVKDPISNGVFYSGEVLVTTTIVQVEASKGWSMVMDSNEKISLYTAALDACFANDIYKDEIVQLLEDAQSIAVKKQKKLNQKVNSTRVAFDLL